MLCTDYTKKKFIQLTCPLTKESLFLLNARRISGGEILRLPEENARTLPIRSKFVIEFEVDRFVVNGVIRIVFVWQYYFF